MRDLTCDGSDATTPLSTLPLIIKQIETEGELMNTSATFCHSVVLPKKINNFLSFELMIHSCYKGAVHKPRELETNSSKFD